jgi:hypothetical protein
MAIITVAVLNTANSVAIVGTESLMMQLESSAIMGIYIMEHQATHVPPIAPTVPRHTGAETASRNPESNVIMELPMVSQEIHVAPTAHGYLAHVEMVLPSIPNNVMTAS